jgi:HEAT repeat protein
MQRDLQHLGEAAGVAAATACRLRTTCREVPVRKVQKELVRLGVLRPEDLQSAAGPAQKLGPADSEAAVRRLGTGEALDAMVDLYRAGPAAAPLVRPLLHAPDPRAREEAALVLGLLHDRAAVPLLLKFLKQRNPRTFVAKLPKASSIPSVPLYYSAVILLGRFRAAEAAPLLRDLLRDSARCPTDLASFTIVALGRIGDREAVAVIKPYLSVAREVTMQQENRDAEASWGVRTTAARVLATLGDRAGVPVLIQLLDSDQSLLRDYALRLLEEITGQRLGKDRRRWESWWRAQNASR